MSQYNLIEESWIPVRDLSGNRKELGIRDVLMTAENLSVIEDPSPLVTAALHRFLLAVLYRAIEGPCDPDEAKKLFKEGLPKDKIQAYFGKWESRFYLFDGKYPLGQIPDFEPKAWRSWTALAAEHNADNAKVLFDHIDVNSAGNISCAMAIRWMLATHTYAVSTGKSELSHTGTAPSAGAVMAIPIGKTLADTLLFCLVPQNREIMQKDLPLWEREPETLKYLTKPVKVRDQKTGEDKDRAVERTANGIVDVYTWRSRTIRFKKAESDKVSDLGLASGVGYLESMTIDPMAIYRIGNQKEEGSEIKEKKRTVLHLEEKGIWRDFDSLLPDNSRLSPRVIENAVELTKNVRDRFPAGILVIGQRYYPPHPNIAFWRNEFFILPSAIAGEKYIRGDIYSFLDEAEKANEELNSACREMGKTILTHGDRNLEPDKRKAGKLIPGDITKYVNSVGAIPHYWSILEANFHKVLRNYTIECNPDDIHHDWLVAVRVALQGAWILHEQSVSVSDAWAIRALVKSGRIIGNKLKELNDSIKKLEGKYEHTC